MRIPAFILEHPVEVLIAGVLLLALMFGSADRHAAEVAAPSSRRPDGRGGARCKIFWVGRNAFWACPLSDTSGRPIRNAPSPFDSPPRVSAL